MDPGNIAQSLGNITQQVVSESLARTELELQKMLGEAEKKIEALFTRKPLLEVSIQGGEAVKLSKRAAPVLPRLILNAKLGINTLLVGPAGCGKTTAAYQVAESFGMQFGSVCLTAGASESWLFGRQTPTGFVEGMFSKIYREGGVFLADEMDAADANLLLSINTALSHGEMLNPMSGEVIKKHKDFVFIAAANTNGKGASHVYTGRSRLDAATLDRFVLIMVDYDKTLEQIICPDKDMYNFLQETREQLKQQNYDEFVSTRAFQTAYLQLEAGIPPQEIKDSLVANWSDMSKDVATQVFKRLYTTTKATKSKTGTLYYTTKASFTPAPAQEGVAWLENKQESESLPF